MIIGGPKKITIELAKISQEESPPSRIKNYIFQVPIDKNDYKAAPFDYKAVNHASMATIGGITRSGRIYEPNPD